VLLSATPYNKSYEDLANQLRLFLSDDADLGISPEKYISSLGGSFQFHDKHRDTHIRTIKAFEKSGFADDWRDVMKLYLIRRTRSFIKKNRAKPDNQNGRKYLEFADGSRSYFPDRIPKKVCFELDAENSDDQYARLYDEKIVALIDRMNLPRYGLKRYHDEKTKVTLTDKENLILKNLSRAGKRIKGFCRTNLYKRLESSGYAFLLSVSRHLLRNYIFIYALNHNLKLPIAGQSIDIDLFDDADGENELEPRFNFSWNAADYEKFGSECYKRFESQMQNRFDWISSEVFDKEQLLQDLRADNESLSKILSQIKKWDSENDRKLVALYDLITKQHKDDKILIFTQFADTAEYVFGHLKKKGVKDIEIVVGGSDNIVDTVTKFSPISNERPDISGTQKELRVLITTDVLSEGQNLQDSHIVVNFDLPWALVRLIQRAGRVDRLGQKSEKILCYSFLPEAGVEKIIKLRAKLKTRISQNAEVVGSDEVFFDGDPINIADLYSEKAGIFDEPEDNEVDLASFAYQIWKNAIDAHPDLKKTIEELPNVVYSAKENDNNLEHSQNGVIVYARTGNDNDALAWLDDNGKIVTQSQYKILKAAKCNINTPPLEKLPNHHDLVKKGIDVITKEDANTGGTLGRKDSVKYRTYKILERFVDDCSGTIFVTTELKKTMNDIFRYPLKEYAIDLISRRLKAGMSDMELADLVVALGNDDKLCIITDEKKTKATQIICSLSLIKEN
jgi:superfamily II DNA or RNA helicase